MNRRGFLRALVQSGLMVRLAPMIGAVGYLSSPPPAEAGLFDSPHARQTMARFADAVVPPDDSAGGAEAGFVEMLYDKEIYRALIGFKVPIAPAIRVICVDLDRRARKRHRARFKHLSNPDAVELLQGALGGRLGLIYEGLVLLVKVCYFGAQVNTVGWDAIEYPGPSRGYFLPVGPPPTHSETEDGNPP